MHYDSYAPAQLVRRGSGGRIRVAAVIDWGSAEYAHNLLSPKLL